MALVDELTIRIQAGDGGDGVVRWRREKYVAKGGPAGGDGARGGDVFVRGVRDMAILEGYVGLPKLAAENGEPGGNRSQHGKNGEDLYIDLPVGSHLTNLQTQEEFEVTEVGQEIKILKGGRGGYGNEHFK
jgi:GTP-binding protein